MPITVSLAEAQIEAHEERLQRLEENQLDIKGDVVATKVKVEGLDEKADTITSKLDKLLDGMEGHGKRLDRLEDGEARRKGVAKWVLGIVTGVVSAALAILLGLQ